MAPTSPRSEILCLLRDGGDRERIPALIEQLEQHFPAQPGHCPPHNLEERPRIEGNLPEEWQDTISVIGGLMRQPSRLVGNRFQAVSVYPRFSWQEALLNAIAHRN
jgi:predicted HTH transcriptional regulator